MKNTLRSPHFLTLFASLGLLLAPVGCKTDEPMGDTGDGDGDMTETTTGDGDGDTPGDGDGDDPTTGDGDGDDPTTGDGDGDPAECVPGTGAGEAGATCTSDAECSSCNCYVVPFLGGQCGECNQDADCAEITGGGCTPPNPFENNGSTCNMGELGGGCETDDACADGLTCGNVLSLLGVVEINTCGDCASDADCDGGTICAPVVVVEDFSGVNTCIEPNSLEQDSFCNLEGNGNDACASGICSVVDIMGLAQIGSCGECNTDADCGGGTCQAGEFILDTGMLVGSTCI